MIAKTKTPAHIPKTMTKANIRQALKLASEKLYNFFHLIPKGWLCDQRVLIRLPKSEIDRLSSFPEITKDSKGPFPDISKLIGEYEKRKLRETKQYGAPKVVSEYTELGPLSILDGREISFEGHGLTIPFGPMRYVEGLYPDLQWFTPSKGKNPPLIGIVSLDDKHEIVAILAGMKH